MPTFATQTGKTANKTAQNPKRTLKICENSSVGRARPCQGRGRGFESRFSLKYPSLQDPGIQDSFSILPLFCQRPENRKADDRQAKTY